MGPVCAAPRPHDEGSPERGPAAAAPFGYIPAMQSAHSALAALVAEIQRQEAAGRAWELAPGDLQRLLDLTPEQYYREIYAARMACRPLVSLDLATERLSQDSILPLVSLLEHLCGAAAESVLERAGIFFSHDQQAEIAAEFLGAAAGTLRAHEFQSEDFTAMLRTFGSIARARQTYLDHYFDLDEVRRGAARRYCAARDFTIPELALRNAEGVLQYLFSKHVLRADSIFGSLHDAFLAAAASAGFADEPPRRERRPPPDTAAAATEQARRAMGLGTEPLTLERIKSRYKQLMKRFHPDVNPNGLRRCQEINVAYSTLVAAVR